jgi:predicted HD phosphohydrolase/predicted nucleotidyltransferase
MADDRIRRQIAFLAAQMMYQRTETEYFTAKRKAARQLGVEYRHRPGDLPSNRDIRDQIQAMARIHEGPKRLETLRDMRLEALRLMRLLARFRPRLIGSVRTGHVRKGSDIDLHIFCDSQALVTDTLDELGLQYDVEHKRIVKYGEERTFTHIHLHDGHKFELTLYPEDKVHYVFKSSITGKAIERASIAELEAILRDEHPGIDLEAEVERIEDQLDPFLLFRMLLEPLEGVKQNPKYHPEGDALYHSLQVFELARDERPYDEEFLLAALLHDVGKAIDPSDHVLAALQSLEGAITARTEWLIAHHMEVQALRAGTLGVKARARIQASEYYDDLMLLSELDRRGRVRGASVCELDQALEFLRELAEQDLEDKTTSWP